MEKLATQILIRLKSSWVAFWVSCNGFYVEPTQIGELSRLNCWVAFIQSALNKSDDSSVISGYRKHVSFFIWNFYLLNTFSSKKLQFTCNVLLGYFRATFSWRQTQEHGCYNWEKVDPVNFMTLSGLLTVMIRLFSSCLSKPTCLYVWCLCMCGVYWSVSV